VQIASCYHKRIENRRTENGNNSSRSQLLMMTIWRPHQTAFKSLVSGKGDWGMGRGSCLGRHFTLYTWRHLRTEIKKDVWNWSFACHHHSMWLGRCTENVLAGWWGGRCTEMCRPRDEGIAVLIMCRPRNDGSVTQAYTMGSIMTHAHNAIYFNFLKTSQAATRR